MMANNLRLELTGTAELERKLGSIAEGVRDRVAVKAVNAAADFLEAAIGASAPSSKTGNLQRSIMAFDRSSHSGALAFVSASFPLGAHRHLVEFGTKERRTKKGRYTGRMPAAPFFGPTFEAHKDEALAIMTEVVERGIEQEAGK